MAGRGREPKLTPDVLARLVEAISNGNTRKNAAAYAGVHPSTLRKWLAKGKKRLTRTNGDYVSLFAAIKKAEAEAVDKHVRLISSAADKHWQAAAWWLERKYPDEWGSDKRLITQLLRDVAALTKAANVNADRAREEAGIEAAAKGQQPDGITGPGQDQERSDLPDEGHRIEPRPVAGGTGQLPVSTDRGSLHPSSGQESDSSVSHSGPLLD
jgi:hypothetical protein